MSIVHARRIQTIELSSHSPVLVLRCWLSLNLCCSSWSQPPGGERRRLAGAWSLSFVQTSACSCSDGCTGSSSSDGRAHARGREHPLALQLPVLILPEQYGADQTSDCGIVWEDPDDAGVALDFLVDPLEQVVAADPSPVLIMELP